MDTTGAETLAALLDDLDERGTRLVLARIRTTVRTTMQRLGVEDRLGVENIDLTVRAAVHAAGQETTFGG
jgi:SulP family sulfate permease